MRQLHAPVIVRIAFLAPRLAVLLPASALTQDAEITTSCACTGFRDPDTSVLVALPVRALVNGSRRSSGFGKRWHPVRRCYAMHWGVDLAAPLGEPVHSAWSGVVEEAGRRGGYGNVVRIRHAHGFVTLYGHVSTFADGIQPGARVRQGQVIAYVGSTGISTGPHLHFEIHLNGHRMHPVCGCRPLLGAPGHRQAQVIQHSNNGKEIKNRKELSQ
jgi:murein DD-endopeptidase MepM/ murein hydrolase activator NlpD